MNILIIGSKGFIGSHATAYFSKKHAVWSADVVNDYNAQNYFQVDATNADFTGIFATQAFDVCINCSGAASVPLSFQNPMRDFELNVSNVFKLLNAIKIHQPECKFINLSSAAVYGNPQYLSINEQHPINPISPYGKHKYFSEQICTEFYQLFQIPTISLRIFSAYGEGLQKQFFWDLYKKILSGIAIELWGTGNESRDFIYVQDLIRVFEIVIEKANFTGQVLNVANGYEIRMADAAQLLLKHLNSNFTVTFNGQVRAGDPTNWCADVSGLKNLGYAANFSLDEGLKNYIVWIRNENV